MTGVVKLEPGCLISLVGGGEFLFIRFRTAELVLVESKTTSERKVVPLVDVRPAVKDDTYEDVSAVTDERWETAKDKYDAVMKVLNLGGGEQAVKTVAAEEEVHPSTLYRWISDYRKSQRVTDLYRQKRSDAGATRLPIRTEVMIRRVILDYHLKQERPSITATYKELERRCHNRKLYCPSIDTFKARLAICPSLEMAVARGQTVLANKLRLNEGTIQGADFPYALVQIDHTRVDIQLVDGEHRISIGRPWLTVAIDVFSRMCVGYYISFDPPGSLGTGLCLTHAILNKQKWMAKLGVNFDYPCQGLPRIIHADNAKEFRGNTLKIVCDKYNMDLQFRKRKRPKHGAHIERLMGTLMSEIHSLPGTTFSNVQDKGDYDSEGRSVFTLAAFERWLANLILGDYHHRPHSGIGDIPPIVKFKQGLVGSEGKPTGQLAIAADEESLYFDFLPAYSLSVQQYGAQLDVIKYSADVLRRWVGSRDPNAPTKPRRFIFRRDPRDISALFFFDPETKVYHRIPYRKLDNPHISVWELRRVRKYLKSIGREAVDEDVIFSARNAMRDIEMQEEAETRKTRRHSAAKKAAKRREESPQPQHGQPAPGRPQELASKDASPQAPAAPKPADAPTVQTGLSGGDGSGSAADGSNQPNKRKIDPFDEVEEF